MNIWDNQHPSHSEYAHYYGDYINQVPKTDIISTLNAQMHEVYTLINSIPGDKAFFTYKEGKWTIKQVIGHMIETERVFAYRALSFSRGDQGPLPGMDQNSWVEHSNCNERTLSNLANEYLAVRVATIHLFSNMNAQMLKMTGMASGFEFSVRALAFIIAGHELHHLTMIKEKYLK